MSCLVDFEVYIFEAFLALLLINILTKKFNLIIQFQFIAFQLANDPLDF